MLLNLQRDDLARQIQQYESTLAAVTMQALAVEFAKDFAALEDEQRPAKAQQAPQTNTYGIFGRDDGRLLCLQDCLFKLAWDRVIHYLCIGQKRFRATKEAKNLCIGKTRYLCIGLKRFRATLEGRETSRGVSLPPMKTPSRYVPPRRAMRRLGASALLPALPRAQSLALAEALILMEIEDPPPHAWIPCVLDGEEGEEEETKVGAQGRRPKRRWTDGRKNSGPNFCRRPEGSEKTKVRVRGLMILKP